MAPFLITYLVFNLFSILFSFVISLHNWDGISSMQYVGLQNYAHILTQDPYFYKSLWSTAILTVFTVPFERAFGLLIAEFVLNLSRARRLFQTINFLPYITTPVAIGIIFALIFDWENGVVNQVLMSIGFIQQNINATLMMPWRVGMVGYAMQLRFMG